MGLHDLGFLSCCKAVLKFQVGNHNLIDLLKLNDRKSSTDIESTFMALSALSGGYSRSFSIKLAIMLMLKFRMCELSSY